MTIQEEIRELAKKVELITGLSEKQSWVIACIAYEYSLPGHGVWKDNT